MKQSIHHLNVDCVHGHLEREMIQCKKMAIYKHPLSPPLYIIFLFFFLCFFFLFFTFFNIFLVMSLACWEEAVRRKKPFTVL